MKNAGELLIESLVAAGYIFEGSLLKILNYPASEIFLGNRPTISGLSVSTVLLHLKRFSR